MLTDSTVHRVAGGNSTAATAFVPAATAALPARRDPVGNARVTVTPPAPPGEAEEVAYHPKYQRRQVIAFGLLLAYVGYAIWVGATHGAETVIRPIAAATPLGLGAVLLSFAVNVTLVHLALRRRGGTVPASFDFRTTDGTAWYKFTDADGIERSGRGKNRGS
ncbi:hypothetical protein [Streptomyces sp. BK79]|uniref:hypothetical protein n=1 Tax=Streptomyces sp. BK79 TaxID=3350097 RepID=UPI00376FDBBB